jgi:hypothetical protein
MDGFAPYAGHLDFRVPLNSEKWDTLHVDRPSILVCYRWTISIASEIPTVAQADDIEAPEAREKAPRVPLSLDAVDADHLIPRRDFALYGLPKFTKVHLSRLCHSGRFPAPVEVSRQRVAWTAGSLRDWRAGLKVRSTYTQDRPRERRSEAHVKPAPAPAPVAIPEDVPLLDRPVSALDGLTRRMLRALAREGVVTVRDLAAKSPGELLRMRDVGALSIDTICRALDAMGLKLGINAAADRESAKEVEPA